MTVRQIPTIPGRRLAIELRQLREQSVKSAEEAADELRELGGRWSKSKITRIEGAQLVPSVRDTNEMLDLYGVQDEEQRAAILELTRNGRNTRGWWLDYRDVLRGGYIAFEAGAASVRTFEPAHIPGLLQTEAYHRALFDVGSDMGLTQYTPEQIDRFVEARQERKRLLERSDPPLTWAIIDEAALRRLSGWPPGVASEQLAHLIEQTARHHINVQVLPASAPAHPSVLHSFALLDFPDPHDPPLLYTESVVPGGQYVDGPDQVEVFSVRFGYLQSLALGTPESLDVIQQIHDQLDSKPSRRG